MTKNEMTSLDFEVNTLYSVANAMDLILRDTEKKMKRDGQCWKYEKKQAFRMFLDNIRKACTICDQLLSQEIIDVERENHFAGYEIWQEEANAFARLVLLLADRMKSPEAIEKIQALIGQESGDGFCTSELLNAFYLKK